jgi:(1->4)-alpha-D-glucan 1-alpha-D-glucosylmutase
MIYQALIGAWPGSSSADFIARTQAFALKAAREGKQATSWIDPNEVYEAVLGEFVQRILDPQVSGGFLSSFDAFAQRTTLLGALNSLSQLALKATLPGVPDFYQGTEFWDLSFVDPDNRRPVDFPARAKMLEAGAADWAELVADWSTGRIKFALMHRLLELRRDRSEILQHGNYQPIDVTGHHRENVIAFSRAWEDQQIVVAVGRHFAPLTRGGRDWPNHWDACLVLPEETYRPILGPHPDSCSGATALSLLFSKIPITVLMRQ